MPRRIKTTVWCVVNRIVPCLFDIVACLLTERRQALEGGGGRRRTEGAGTAEGAGTNSCRLRMRNVPPARISDVTASQVITRLLLLCSIRIFTVVYCNFYWHFFNFIQSRLTHGFPKALVDHIHFHSIWQCVCFGANPSSHSPRWLHKQFQKACVFSHDCHTVVEYVTLVRRVCRLSLRNRCDECCSHYHFRCLDPPRKTTPKLRGYTWCCDACCSDSEVSTRSCCCVYMYTLKWSRTHSRCALVILIIHIFMQCLH